MKLSREIEKKKKRKAKGKKSNYLFTRQHETECCFIHLFTLEQLKWEILSHPVYSPDLDLSDIYILLSLQHVLENNQFKNTNKVQICIDSFFGFKPELASFILYENNSKRLKMQMEIILFNKFYNNLTFISFYVIKNQRELSQTPNNNNSEKRFN